MLCSPSCQPQMVEMQVRLTVSNYFSCYDINMKVLKGRNEDGCRKMWVNQIGLLNQSSGALVMCKNPTLMIMNAHSALNLDIWNTLFPCCNIKMLRHATKTERLTENTLLSPTMLRKPWQSENMLDILIGKSQLNDRGKKSIAATDCQDHPITVD